VGKRRNQQPEPEINVTPLVDVVLVLLIIFMVIAPAIAEGEHVELPKIVQPDPKQKDMEPIEVTMAANGILVLDKERIQPAALKERLRQLHAKDPTRVLLLKSDETIPYKNVRETFAQIQTIGFKGVSLKVLERKNAGT
jgi:biopolymer transport protein ExbD/biopolymer transport protein TolR